MCLCVCARVRAHAWSVKERKKCCGTLTKNSSLKTKFFCLRHSDTPSYTLLISPCQTGPQSPEYVYRSAPSSERRRQQHLCGATLQEQLWGNTENLLKTTAFIETTGQLWSNTEDHLKDHSHHPDSLNREDHPNSIETTRMVLINRGVLDSIKTTRIVLINRGVLSSKQQGWC